jgi:urea transport system ATP-binding protein
MTAKILDIDHVTVSFDGFKALNDLTFSMEPGELRVIIGPNGAGKTTFLDVITGKVRPTEGKARFKGRDVTTLKEHEIARLGVGRKFQTPRVYLNLTPRENLEISCNHTKTVFNTLFGQQPRSERQTVASLLETIGLTAQADVPAGLLSHGQKQWLEIGMLVAQSPDLLLVDEPVAGLTDEETERTGELLMALAESHSVIVIEHDMEFVRQIARKVTVLHEGSVLFEGSMSEVQTDPRVIEVYLGTTPSISAEQIAMLRIAASMAWADGSFAPVERELILTRLSQQFASDREEQELLRQELQDYLAKDIPLDELVPLLTTTEQRETALKLSYEVICSNQINDREARVYQELVQLLELPTEAVQRVEQTVKAGTLG